MYDVAPATFEAVKSKLVPEQTGPELDAVTVHPQVGAVKFVVLEQVPSAEKLAVTAKVPPFPAAAGKE